jgi:hypothetical protein
MRSSNRRRPRRCLDAVRFDDQEMVRNADDVVCVCVGQSNDETVRPTAVPFDLQRQQHAAVGPGALAEELVRGVTRRRLAVAAAVFCARSLSPSRELS